MQQLNANIISALTELKNMYESSGDIYRMIAYQKAINKIQLLNFQINKRNVDTLRAKKIPGLGVGIIEKIREFVTRGRITELITYREKLGARRELSKILGVGPLTVDKWLKLDITSLPSLRKAIADGEVILTHMQKLGLRYYNDLNTRIPRAEVAAIGNYVKSLSLIDPNTIFMLAGSYRREKADSGDVDIIISCNNCPHDQLHNIVDAISQDSNFVDIAVAGESRVTFLLRSPISNVIRQVDILSVAYDSFYAALNYFTGGFVHNTWIRGVAKKQGYRLNQSGLFSVKNGELKNIPLNSEQELYKLLGVDYIEPKDRL